MAKIKFDVTDVEAREDFDEPLPKGVYKMRIVEIEETTSGNDGRPMLKVELEVAEGDKKGRKLWDYIKHEDDSSAWKVLQLTQALELGGKGEIDTKKAEGRIVVVKVKHEKNPEYNDGEPSAKVGSMMPLPKGQAEEAEPEAEEEESEPEGEEEELTLADVEGMNKSELKDLIEEQEISGIRVTKKSKVANVRVKVIEALGLAEEEEEEVEAPEDWDALTALDDEEAAALIEQEELEVDTGELDGHDLYVAIAEEMGIEVPEESEEEETPSYSEMDVADLRGECKERGLPSKGGKKALIARLEKDDNGGSGDGDADPF